MCSSFPSRIFTGVQFFYMKPYWCENILRTALSTVKEVNANKKQNSFALEDYSVKFPITFDLLILEQVLYYIRSAGAGAGTRANSILHSICLHGSQFHPIYWSWSKFHYIWSTGTEQILLHAIYLSWSKFHITSDLLSLEQILSHLLELEQIPLH